MTSLRAPVQVAVAGPQVHPTSEERRPQLLSALASSENVQQSLSLEDEEPTIAVLPRVRKRGHVGSQIRVGNSQFMVWGAAKSGVMPKGLALSVDGTRLFASNIGRLHRDNIAVYKTDPLTFERFVSYEGSSIEIYPSSDGMWLFSTNMHKAGFLDILDTETLSLWHHIRLKGFPKIILPNDAGDTIFLSLWSGDGITKVSWPELKTETMKLKRGRNSDGTLRRLNPRGMALSSDEKTLYVANNKDDTLSLIDTDTFTERRRIHLGRSPRHIVQSTDKKTLYISLIGKHAVAVFDTKEEKVTGWLRTGSSPKGLALSADERFLYAANYGGSSLHIIDLQSGKGKELPLNVLKVSGLVAHPNDDFIYVTGWCNADVWAIQRIDDGEAPLLPLGYNKPNKPCYECDSPFVGCPKQSAIRDWHRSQRAAKSD